jgi:adenylate cyclase
LVLVRFPAAGRGLLVAAALVALYTAGMFLAFSRAHLWLPLVAPVSAMVLSYVSVGALRYATVGRDLRRTRGTLDRYISPALVNYVLDHLDAVNLRGDKRELTILISDVRNFTTWTERSDPEQLIQLLNEYLTAMTEVIFKYDGIVDKFIGDGILAYWGAFTPGENHALLAAQAALEMLDRLKDLNQRWKARGNEPIAIGIGMNTGEVIFGNIGAGKKIEFTVIGDPVNLASRLEGVNKEFHTSIIISQATREKLGELAQVRALGSVKVKGKTVETSIFELQGLASRAPEHVAAQTAAAAQAD